MAVLDTAAKNREELLYDRYTRGPRRDRALHQRSALRLHHSARAARQPDGGRSWSRSYDRRHRGPPGHAETAPDYKEGDWVILMDQPFAALVKELFDVQKYPRISARAGGVDSHLLAAAGSALDPAARQPAGRGAARAGWRPGRGAGAPPLRARPPAQLPYDVTGWTLPLQMGVEVGRGRPALRRHRAPHHAQARSRRTYQPAKSKAPARSSPSRTTPTPPARRQRSAGRRRRRQLRQSRRHHLRHGGIRIASCRRTASMPRSLKEAPAAWAVKKPRIGLYEPWIGIIDEGWTRWILEQYHFPSPACTMPMSRTATFAIATTPS